MSNAEKPIGLFHRFHVTILLTEKVRITPVFEGIHNPVNRFFLPVAVTSTVHIRVKLRMDAFGIQFPFHKRASENAYQGRTMGG